MSWAPTSDSPVSLAISGNYIYSLNQGNNTISKINLTNPSGDNTPIWTTVGNTPISLAIYGVYIYCTNYTDNTISKIDLATGIANNIWLDLGAISQNNPAGLTIDSTGNMYCSINSNDTIIKITNITGTPVVTTGWATLTLNTYSRGLATDGVYIYSANTGNSTISKILLTNPIGDITPAWVTLTNGPGYGLAIDDGYIYSVNPNINTISKIFLANPTIINQNWTESGSNPNGLAINGGFIYVTSQFNSIWKLSLSSPNIWATTGNNPFGLAIGGGYIYCANYNDSTISKISLTNPTGDNNPTWTTTGNYPFNLAIYGGYIYCTNQNNNTISKIDLATGLADNTWLDLAASVLSNPTGLTIDATGVMYCAINGDNIIIKITSITTTPFVTINWSEVSGPVSSGPVPVGLAISGGYIYCANNGDKTISKISLTSPDGDNNPTWVTLTNGPGFGLAIDGGYIYCGNLNNNIGLISKISLTDTPIINQNWAFAGNNPNGVAISGGYIYESNQNSNTIWKINLTTPCFNKGTKILCLNSMKEEEYIQIENLKKGDLVKSYLHGYRKIDSIGKNSMINNPEHFNLSMYKMEKTDTNGLIEDLIVTGGHSILVDDLGEYYNENNGRFKGKIPKIDDKYFLLSAVSKEFTQLKDTNEYTYYHLVLENNGNNDERFGIWANGILSETISKNQFSEIEQILH